MEIAHIASSTLLVSPCELQAVHLPWPVKPVVALAIASYLTCRHASVGFLA